MENKIQENTISEIVVELKRLFDFEYDEEANELDSFTYLYLYINGKEFDGCNIYEMPEKDDNLEWIELLCFLDEVIDPLKCLGLKMKYSFSHGSMVEPNSNIGIMKTSTIREFIKENSNLTEEDLYPYDFLD